MFFLVPGFSVAAKCTVIGAACVTVAAVEMLQASSLVESFKTKAGSAFAKWRAAAKPPVSPEVASDDSPEVTNPGENLSVFGVLEMGAAGNDNEILKASVATGDAVKFGCDPCVCIDVHADQVAVLSSTLQSSTIDTKTQAIDKLSAEAVNVVGWRSIDARQHLDSMSDVVGGVQTACGQLPLMADLEGEAADVKTKEALMAVILDHHLDPIGEKNAEVIMTNVRKTQSVSSTGNSCRANNPNGRSWASRVFKGTHDFVMGPINNIRSWMSRVFNNAGDFLRGFIDGIRFWFGKMYGGIYGCVETVGPKKLISDNQVILKILFVFADFFMETSSFLAPHKSKNQLIMRFYRLLKSELRGW